MRQALGEYRYLTRPWRKTFRGVMDRKTADRLVMQTQREQMREARR